MPGPKSPLLKIREVAELLAISQPMVRKLADSGELPCVDLSAAKSRRVLRFAPEDVDKFLEERSAAKKPATKPKRKAKLSSDGPGRKKRQLRMPPPVKEFV